MLNYYKYNNTFSTIHTLIKQLQTRARSRARACTHARTHARTHTHTHTHTEFVPRGNGWFARNWLFTSWKRTVLDVNSVTSPSPADRQTRWHTHTGYVYQSQAESCFLDQLKECREVVSHYPLAAWVGAGPNPQSYPVVRLSRNSYRVRGSIGPLHWFLVATDRIVRLSSIVYLGLNATLTWLLVVIL